MKEQISKERQRLERVTGAVHAITGFLNHQRVHLLSVDEASIEQFLKSTKRNLKELRKQNK